MQRTLRTNEDVQVEYFRDHPEEIFPFIEEIFEAYAEDGDTAVLLGSLRIVAEVKGIAQLASEIGMTRQCLHKALSERGNPHLSNVNAIMHALGYRLKVEKIESSPTAVISTESQGLSYDGRYCTKS